MELSKLIKEKNSYKQIKAEFLNKLSSASFLFVCKDITLAKEYAVSLAEEIVNDYLKVREGFHADVKIYGEAGQNFLTEDAKNFILDTSLKPLEAEDKIYIFCNANKLSIDVQNKMLKTIEEPPKNTYLIFLAESEENLLNTIKSRLFKFEISKLNKQEFEKVFKNYEDLYEKTLGNITIAKKFIEDKLFKASYDIAIKIFENMKKSSEILSYRCLFNKENTMEIFKAFRLIYENYINAGFNSSNKEENNSEFNLVTITAEIEVLNKAIKKINANCLYISVVDCFLLEFLEVKHKWKNY